MYLSNKLKMKTALVVAIFTLLLSTVNAQEEVTQSPLHSLGVAAGASSGLGFSYRYQTNQLGFEVTGIPVFNGSNQLFLSTGASLIYRIRTHEKMDVFVYYGNHLFYNQREMIVYDFPSDSYNTTIKKTTNLTMGLGAGVNIHIADYLDLSLKAGYGLYNYNRYMSATIVGGVGFYYLF